MKHFSTPPTPEQIALGLSTVPRWTGRTILDRVGLRWSVLQHTLVGMTLFPDPLDQITFGLHDAEEFVTGDVPRPYKTTEQSELGREIRWEIFHGLNLPRPTESRWERIKEADKDVQCAERWVLMHPVEVLGGNEPDPDLAVVDQVWGLLDIGPRDAIEMYTELVYDLLATPTVRTLAGRV